MKSIVMYTAAAMSSNDDIETSFEASSPTSGQSCHGEVQVLHMHERFSDSIDGQMINLDDQSHIFQIILCDSLPHYLCTSCKSEQVSCGQ